MRPSPIRIEGERLGLQFIGPLEVAFRVAGNAKRRPHPELDPQHLQGADILGIDDERLFAERICCIRLLADPSGLLHACGALESQVLGVAIGRRRLFDACALGLDELKIECARQMRDDRVLCLQQIGAGRVELFGPEVSAAAGVDELGVDPHPVAARLHRSFENIAHAQILADRLRVDRLALEGHGSVARDDEGVADARETGGQFIGQGVDEVVLPRIAREIGEGQHDDRKPRGLGGRLRGDACGPVRIEEPPRAARDHNQQRRERGGERRKPETPLLRRGRTGVTCSPPVASPARGRRPQANRPGSARRCS